jgi:RimJ/RimL family protein N-acetyltransferase
MTPPLETARLVLRPLALEDASQTQAIFPIWEIVQYLNAQVPWPFPPDGVEMYFRNVALPAIASGEEWHWTIRLKTAPGQIIGIISLRRKEHHNRGFWLHPEWQGRGLMTEACAAVNDYWFDVLREPVMQTSKAVGNEGSRRISQRQGMRLVGMCEADYVSGRLPTEIWEITAEEWRTHKRASPGS